MDEAKAIEVLTNYAARSADLKAKLEVALNAEEYDTCDILTAEQDDLEAEYSVAREIVPMTVEEAQATLSSFAQESASLQTAVDAKMAEEDYDACDTIQAELDALSERHAIALKLCGGAPAAPSGSAPSEEAPAPAEEVPAPAAPVEEVPVPAAAMEEVAAPLAAVPDAGASSLGGFDFAAPAASGGFDFAAPAAPDDASAAPADTLGVFDFAAAAQPPAEAANDEMTKDQAEALLGEISALEAQMEEAMGAENYELCDDLNKQIEELSARKEKAQDLLA